MTEARKHEGETTEKGQEAGDWIIRSMLMLFRHGFEPPDVLTAIAQAAAIVNVIFAPDQARAEINAANFGESFKEFARLHFKDRAEIMADYGVALGPDKEAK